MRRAIKRQRRRASYLKRKARRLSAEANGYKLTWLDAPIGSLALDEAIERLQKRMYEEAFRNTVLRVTFKL